MSKMFDVFRERGRDEIKVDFLMRAPMSVLSDAFGLTDDECASIEGRTAAQTRVVTFGGARQRVIFQMALTPLGTETLPSVPRARRPVDPPYGSQSWAETRGDDLGASPDY